MTHATPSIKAADLQRIGISKPYAHQLISGARTPSLKLALRIQAELGIAPASWPLPANDASVEDPEVRQQAA